MRLVLPLLLLALLTPAAQAAPKPDSSWISGTLTSTWAISLWNCIR